MKTVYGIILFTLFFNILAAQSLKGNGNSFHELKGYKRIVYKLVSIHPKLNSALEKDLLKHYLLGSGSTYQISDSDFVRLKMVSKFYLVDTFCRIIHSNNEKYCYRLIDLINDNYFGWGLGTISGIFQQASDELISFADVYDFNKKEKGKRKFKYEFITGFFRFITPSTAKKFVVTYNADGYLLLH